MTRENQSHQNSLIKDIWKKKFATKYIKAEKNKTFNLFIQCYSLVIFIKEKTRVQ